MSLYREVFSNLNVLYIQRLNEINLAKAKLSVLETDRDAIKTAYLTAQTAAGQNEEYDEEIEELRQQLEDKEAEIEEQNEYIEMLQEDADKTDQQIQDVVSICRITSYFNEDEVKILSQYFKQDSIADDTFVIPEYSSSILQSGSNSLDVITWAISKSLGLKYTQAI